MATYPAPGQDAAALHREAQQPAGADAAAAGADAETQWIARFLAQTDYHLERFSAQRDSAIDGVAAHFNAWAARLPEGMLLPSRCCVPHDSVVCPCYLQVASMRDYDVHDFMREFAEAVRRRLVLRSPRWRVVLETRGNEPGFSVSLLLTM